MGPLRWDHQKSDEFEATLRLTGEAAHWGDESNLKFARLLTTPLCGDLIAAFAAKGPDISISFPIGQLDFHQIGPSRRLFILSKEPLTDSLTSTYRGFTPFSG